MLLGSLLANNLLIASIFAGFLIQAFRKGGLKLVNKWTIILTVAVIILSLIIVGLSFVYTPIANMFAYSTYSNFAIIMALIWMLIFVLMNKTYLVDKLSEGRALVELMLIWFLALYSLNTPTMQFLGFFSAFGYYFWIGLGVFTVLVVLVSFTNYFPNTGTKAILFAGHAIINLVCISVLALPYLNNTLTNLSAFDTIINGVFIGIFGAVFLANAAQALAVLPEKRESSWRYEKRMLKYFSGEENIYIDKDISRKAAALIVIVLSIVFTIIALAGVVEISWIIIVTMLVAEFAHQKNISEKDRVLSPDYSEIKQV